VAAPDSGTAGRARPAKAYVATFREALANLGWMEGRNLLIDSRSGEINLTRMQAQAAENR
jgi:hypothetical protein